MSAANKELSRRFTEVFSTGDEALADEILSPAVVFHGTAGDGELHGVGELKAFVAGYRQAFPDARSTLDDDVNKWTALARERRGVRTLAQATAGDMKASSRYRDIFRPLGLDDELRAVLRVGGACWGFICLHREAGAAFSRREVDFVHRLAPHLAEGIRAGLLVSLSSTELADVADAPRLVVVASDGSLL